MTLDAYGGLYYMRKLSLGECLTYLREHSGGKKADTHAYKELGSRQGKTGVKGPVRRLLLEFRKDMGDGPMGIVVWPGGDVGRQGAGV